MLHMQAMSIALPRDGEFIPRPPFPATLSRPSIYEQKMYAGAR